MADGFSVLRNSDIRTIAAMYFFLKMNRFTLLLWLPLYLVQTVHYSDGLANSTSALFELFRIRGSGCGHLCFQSIFSGSSRYPVAIVMLLALGFISLLEPLVSLMGMVGEPSEHLFYGLPGLWPGCLDGLDRCA